MEASGIKRMSPDEFEINVLTHVGVCLEFTKLLQGYDKISTSWYPLKEWEKTPDSEILSLLNAIAPFEGNLNVVVDAAYTENFGIFELAASKLDSFVTGFLEQYGVCFFNGDTTIVGLDKKLVWMFHHDGYYAVASVEAFE